VIDVSICAAAGLHVDFDTRLEPFYLDTCGFRSTPAGFIYPSCQTTPELSRPPNGSLLDCPIAPARTDVPIWRVASGDSEAR
jgi:hypothetical protein